MHMAWMRQVCGRLKSDYRYSNKVGLQEPSLAEAPTAKQRVSWEKLPPSRARRAGAEFPTHPLRTLYDPLWMRRRHW